MSSLPVPKLLRAIYVHNPFYLISACLFVYGLQAVFRPGEVDFFFERHSVAYIDPWWLMLSLCGVTLLMAVTAYLIVRLGRVWEDARTLVLVLLLMFLAISVSFDEIVTLASWDADSASTAVSLFVFGYCFSIGICEALLRGLRIRLPLGYRAPFYGLLALFYAFPLFLSPEVADVTADDARWRIAAFPLLAGFLTLSLLPAVRRGSGNVRDNGTPWSWPWFPWTLFVFMAGAVCFRSFSLSISFDLADARKDFWDSAFGPYLLVPFCLAALFVLFEIGLVERLEKLQTGVLASAPALLLMAYPWLGPWSRQFTYQHFVYDFVENVGSPVFLTLLGLLAFYSYAVLRGVRRAEMGLVACLLLAVAIEPDSFGVREYRFSFESLQSWPLLVIGVVELFIGGIQRRSQPALIGATSLSLAVGLLVGESASLVFKATLMYHLVVLSMVVIGLTFRDELASRVRKASAAVLVLSVLVVVVTGLRHSVHGLPLVSYVVLMSAIAAVCWVIARERHFLIAAVMNLSTGLCGAIVFGWRLLQQISIPPGVRPLFWAVLCFSVGVLISALKGGLAARWMPDQAAADRDGSESLPDDETS